MSVTDFFACRMLAWLGDHPYSPYMLDRLRYLPSRVRLHGVEPGFFTGVRALQPDMSGGQVIDCCPSYARAAQDIPFAQRPLDVFISLNFYAEWTREGFQQRWAPTTREGRLANAFYESLRHDRTTFPLALAEPLLKEFYGASWAELAQDFEQLKAVGTVLDAVDLCVRGERRLEILHGLLRDTGGLRIAMVDSGLPPLPKISNVEVIPTVKASALGRIMGQSRVVLHVHPTYPGGVHERVINAMAAGSAVLSDPVPRLHELFGDNEGWLALQPGESLREVVMRVGPDSFAEVAAAGQAAVRARFSADAYVQRLLALAEAPETSRAASQAA